ncbi:uncharacterized protein APUU_10353A [Aspergillus puulaauensis]|uniref:Heat shock protein 9/12-domain-containing protein n=1 Tax=Aspergillus puulaauensis TaxID=1220207 RepID=A0A7R7XA67_9EURO|nr:uncharacterized protein APUU_10353A [Aspergillus puulaauensis]BCS17525.1 hypothetical protein APUU_10353A [Aspergillus puulaauensis]
MADNILNQVQGATNNPMAQSAKNKGQEFVSNKISGNKDQQGQGGQGGQGEKKSSNPLKSAMDKAKEKFTGGPSE